DGIVVYSSFFFFQAEDGIRDYKVTGVQTCALPISSDLQRDCFQSANDPGGGGNSHWVRLDHGITRGDGPGLARSWAGHHCRLARLENCRRGGLLVAGHDGLDRVWMDEHMPLDTKHNDLQSLRIERA